MLTHFSGGHFTTTVPPYSSPTIQPTSSVSTPSPTPTTSPTINVSPSPVPLANRFPWPTIGLDSIKRYVKYSISTLDDNTCAITNIEIEGFEEKTIQELYKARGICLPSKINNYTVVSIKAHALDNFSVLRNVIVPDTITEICEGALVGSEINTIVITNPNCRIAENACNPKCLIYGYRNSTAFNYVKSRNNYFSSIYDKETFKKEYEYKFLDLELVGNGVHISGDMNDDRRLDSKDIVCMIKYFWGESDIPNWKIIDINMDNVIDVTDLISEKNELLHMIIHITPVASPTPKP